MSKKTKWIIGILGALVVAGVGAAIAGARLAKRVDPYVREQAIAYLSRRFDAEVEFGDLRIRAPHVAALQFFLHRGTGVMAAVDADRIVLRHKGRRDIPPLLSIRKVHFQVDIGQVLRPGAKTIQLIQLEGLDLCVPPKGQRPELSQAPQESAAQSSPAADIRIERIEVAQSSLTILPHEAGKTPLEFALHRLTLRSVERRESMDYEVSMNNARPPGLITATGKFGPWDAETPGDTPLSGDYLFSHADLGVFPAIAGTLDSKGSFEGALSAITAKGVADVPNFQLRAVGTPMPLHTEFEALVDGGNGNTELRPVKAVLGSTRFITSGAVIRQHGDRKRTIELDVRMPDGELKDLLKLAAKGKPFMSGKVNMSARIHIPPLSGDVKEKLILDGRFSVDRGQFLQDTVQDKLDTLSRRGQGEPKNAEIDNVFSKMAGDFHLESQLLHLRKLTFDVPGASVNLSGDYEMSKDDISLAGALRLQAKVSQTMTGWKRWALKPIDPLFARNGAGTFLKIRVEGTSKEPRFSASR